MIRRSFTLDSQRDAALLAWLDTQPNSSETVRAALRAYYDAAQVTLADVYQVVQALEQRLSTGMVLSTPAPASIAEDPELANALDHLGL